MMTRNIGITDLYNAIDDPTCAAPDIRDLRAAQESLDHAVTSSYGWLDLVVELNH